MISGRGEDPMRDCGLQPLRRRWVRRSVAILIALSAAAIFQSVNAQGVAQEETLSGQKGAAAAGFGTLPLGSFPLKNSGKKAIVRFEADQGFCHGCKSPAKSKCDQKALDQAKAELERDLADAREDEAKSKAIEEQLDTLYEEGNTAFEKAAEPVAPWGLFKEVTVHAIAEKVFEQAVAQSLGEAAAETATKVFGTSLAAQTLAKFTIGMTNSMVTDLRVLERSKALAAQGAQAADGAVDALERANAAKSRLDDLEKACSSATSSTKGTGSQAKADGDNFKSSGQKDAEAAEKLLQSWKKVEGGYEDSQGDFYDANLAFQQALEIVQARQNEGLLLGDRFMLAAFKGQSSSGGQSLSATEYKSFVTAMANAFMHIAKGYKEYEQIGVNLQQLKELPE